GGITNSPGTTINLGNVNNLLVATQSGSITLDSGVSFSGSSGKPALILFYARGGDITIGSQFNLGPTDLRFAAENNAVFNPTAAITAQSLTITGLQNAQFDGSATLSNIFQLNGGTV